MGPRDAPGDAARGARQVTNDDGWAALGVVLDHLELFWRRAFFDASDFARLAAVDRRARDAVRSAENVRRVAGLPPWVDKPWPALFATNPYARLTPACKVWPHDVRVFHCT